MKKAKTFLLLGITLCMFGCSDDDDDKSNTTSTVPFSLTASLEPETVLSNIMQHTTAISPFILSKFSGKHSSKSCDPLRMLQNTLFSFPINMRKIIHMPLPHFLRHFSVTILFLTCSREGNDSEDLKVTVGFSQFQSMLPRRERPMAAHTFRT